MRNLILKGVRQNNLKDINLEIPLGTSVVVTGPSGSGKSSLAFETIYAEGQRRYMQSLSTYARQFLQKFQAPDADQIQNIPPTVALEQFNPVRNSRATVGTSTEIYDYLRLLFEKIGIELCPDCKIPMEHLSYPDLLEVLRKERAGSTLFVGANVSIPTAAQGGDDLLQEFIRSGFSRAIAGKEVVRIEEAKASLLGRQMCILIDRIRIPDADDKSILTRLGEACRIAIVLGKGTAQLYVEVEKRPEWVRDFTTQVRCPRCKKLSDPKTATSFSFNNPLGACQTCKGFGNTLDVDPELVVPNPGLSIARGAVDPFTKPSLSHWQRKLLQFCKENRIDADLPFRELPQKQRQLIFDGQKKFPGINGVFQELSEEKYKLRIRVFVSRYTSAFTCKNCGGSRLNVSALRVQVGGKNIAEVCGFSTEHCREFLKDLSLRPRERTVVKDVLSQLTRRLDTLQSVGLGYLTLSRLTRSLSGGEYQRILLATQLSQGLTDTLYVLDEPSIGLHPTDTKKLLSVLSKLRAQGNSLVVVEHDPEVIQWGEYVVDMGPGSGRRGGDVIFQGSREHFLLSTCETSLSIRSWKDECKKAIDRVVPEQLGEAIEIRGARENNLKGIDLSIPLRRLVAVTGVSGSGKSTLMIDTLYQALSKIFNGRSEKIGRFESISGFEHLLSVELVDQAPIGKSSRSNPITFIKGYDEVRSIFAGTAAASSKGLTPGHFSFNVAGGRCETCDGEGRISIDMAFMEEVWIPCEACLQKRFKPHILAVRYRGRNIDDILKMTVDDAYDFFHGTPSLRTKLSLLQEVGLGYLQLGQPGYSLSGGEAQRIKIARELSAVGHRRGSTLFILDEPSTGLHFSEVRKLLSVLKRLVSHGHSVILIEHNAQMICAADFVIDLGPDGGDQGGHVVDIGTPKELAQKKLAHTGRYLAEILN